MKLAETRPCMALRAEFDRWIPPHSPWGKWLPPLSPRRRVELRHGFMSCVSWATQIQHVQEGSTAQATQCTGSPGHGEPASQATGAFPYHP